MIEERKEERRMRVKVKEICMHILYTYYYMYSTCIYDMSYNLLFGISPHPANKEEESDHTSYVCMFK